MTATQHSDVDDSSQPIRFWSNKYPTKFLEEPTVFSVYGHQLIDGFLRAANKAGTNLTSESFIKAVDTLVIPADMFGTTEMTFSSTKRLGSEASRMSQIHGGKWKVVSDCITTK